MSKVNVKIVVGANYGDEGKGLATDFFARKASGKCLNVLYNGGPQRGHTVELKGGKRHVFHHFGSGTFANAHTLFDKDFMVNPILFAKECDELVHDGVDVKCFVSPDCRVTTPYDMIINQIVEITRQGEKHGSCGCGIWETQRRYQDGTYSLRYSDMVRLNDSQLLEYIHSIAEDYFYEQMKFYGIEEIPEAYKDLIGNDTMERHYINDLRYMQQKSKCNRLEFVFNDYQTIIFEGGQGLALSETNFLAYPHTTPSSTGSVVPIKRIATIHADLDVEVCYVTRSYFTRHGAGPFPTECTKSEINSSIEDATNVTNEFQDSIRYGRFSKDEFYNRVFNDMIPSNIPTCEVRRNLMVTHLNYTNGDIFGDCDLKDMETFFETVYKSSTKFSEDITC